MATSSTYIIAIVFASLVAESYQIKCYTCSEGDFEKMKIESVISNNLNFNCGNYRDSLLVQCHDTAKVCVKVEAESDRESAVVHGCGRNKDVCDVIDGDTDGTVTMKCNSCNTDGCNSASGFAATSVLLVLGIIADRLY